MTEDQIFGSPGAPAARYDGWSTRSVHIPMRDGVRLAADIVLPNSTDGQQVRSSEYTAIPAERPVLTVLAQVFYCDDDGDCSDGEFCNGVETCNLGTNRCEPGTPVDCDDQVWCTGDSCNEASDQCEYTLCWMGVDAVGSRYLEITPPGNLSSVAIRVYSASLSCPVIARESKKPVPCPSPATLEVPNLPTNCCCILPIAL